MLHQEERQTQTEEQGSTTHHPDPSVEQRSRFTRSLAEQVQEDLDDAQMMDA